MFGQLSRCTSKLIIQFILLVENVVSKVTRSAIGKKPTVVEKIKGGGQSEIDAANLPIPEKTHPNWSWQRKPETNQKTARQHQS